MQLRKIAVGLLMLGTISTASLATALPAWAADPGAPGTGASVCRITASAPYKSGGRLHGDGARSGCSDTVTYLWVRVYEDITWWPDSERGVTGRNYVQNGQLTATGTCDGHGLYYTYTSTASGASGDSVESGRAPLC